jgi:uncharacterized protein YeaO (DUF488 family)
MTLKIRRAYEPAESSDGTRILVDGLWPRGVSRDEAKVDLWLKEVAPSARLRRWYGHRPERWPEFRRRYFAELDAKPEVVAQLREVVGRGKATLVFAARDAEHSNAQALLEYLKR